MTEVPNSRRITQIGRPHDALKAVAGMIKGLSYTEMKTLSEKIAGKSELTLAPGDVPDMLIAAADEILNS